MAMASICGLDCTIPLSLPVDDDGVVWVSEAMLSQRFGLVRTSMWLEMEVFGA
jgi:hypothetical protein